MRRLLVPLVPVAAAIALVAVAPEGLPRVAVLRAVSWIVAAILVLDLARRVRSVATAWAAVILVALVEALVRLPVAEAKELAFVAIAVAALDLGPRLSPKTR